MICTDCGRRFGNGVIDVDKPGRCERCIETREQATNQTILKLAEALANPDLPADENIKGTQWCLYDLVSSCTDADTWEEVIHSLLEGGGK